MDKFYPIKVNLALRSGFVLKTLGAVALMFGFLFNKAKITYAQITNPAIGALGDDVEGAGSGALFVSYFVLLWRALIMFGAIAVIVLFVWGALDWILAGGDASKLEKARLKMLHAALGLIILVSSFTLVGFIGWLFFGGDFDLLDLTIPSAFDLGQGEPDGGSRRPDGGSRRDLYIELR